MNTPTTTVTVSPQSPGDTLSGSPSSLSSASLRVSSRPASLIAFIGLGAVTGATGALLYLAVTLAKAGAHWPAVAAAGIGAVLMGLALVPVPVLEALKLVAPRLPGGKS